MQIDWITVGAQWINFLILMWLLRRFLYQPIIRAMDKRQQAISNRTLEARQKAEQADQLALEYKRKLSELETRQAELIGSARDQAALEKENLIRQARAEVQALASSWRAEVEREKIEFQNRLSRDLGHLIVATARKAVQDFSGLEWERAVFNRFLAQLRQLPEADKQRLRSSVDERLVLASSFDLDLSMQNQLCEALGYAPEQNQAIEFETLPGNQAGLRLSSSAYSTEWTIDHYFSNLDTELETVLTKTPEPEAARDVE
ncbi:F0F1 ATP synthase subunit B [Methylomonas sp. MgM2]